MRTAPLLAFAFLSLVASGCRPVSEDPVYRLGRRGLSGYRVAAGASTFVPDGDFGYALTANGQGGFRLVWIDTVGHPTAFQGSITTDASFEPNSTILYSGTESVTNTTSTRIDFAGRPGANLQGVDFVALTEPIYLDLLADGSSTSFGIFFTGAVSGRVRESAYNPVAFTSP